MVYDDWSFECWHALSESVHIITNQQRGNQPMMAKSNTQATCKGVFGTQCIPETLEMSTTNLSQVSWYGWGKQLATQLRWWEKSPRASFLEAENTEGDKGRSLGPRTTRSKNRLHMSGKHRLLTLLIQGKEACIVKLSSLQPHPRPPLPPFPLHPWNHRPAWSSIPGVTRGVQGPHQEPPLCQRPVDQCPLTPRHPCHCTRDWTWTQLPEGFQACQGRNQDQGPSPKRIVPSVGTESKPDPEA